MSAVGAAAGLALDQRLGEPPAAWHPVARFGSLMGWVEGRLYADRRSVGVAHLAVAVAVGGGVGLALRRVLGGRAASTAATLVCAAGRMLDDEALTMARLLRQGDLGSARHRVRSLVGRSADGLDEVELSRAVIESIAENGVDAVTATAMWAVCGGAPGALVHRAVNTLDAMVGHRDARYERFGWASARADDVLNYAPARLTAVGVMLARPRRAGAVWRTVRRDAGRHPSPNGGVVEAAFAAALNVRLGGVNRYDDEIQDRGTLGDGRPPTVADIEAAVRLRRHATVATMALLLVVRGLALTAARQLAGAPRVARRRHR